MYRYKEVAMLGRGTYGVASLVHAVGDESKLLVMKKMQVDLMGDGERALAEKEATVLEKLHHPNIVRYVETFVHEPESPEGSDGDEDDRLLCIVMEFADAGDLAGLVGAAKTHNKLFPQSIVLHWFVQLCLALEHVHAQNILHRDLKTANVFITSQNRIKLGDFGIAKTLSDTSQFAQTFLGTPYNLSPEICEGKEYGKESDVWALGCLLYELCTLKPAFHAPNLPAIVLKIIQGTYDTISPSEYDPEVQVLIDRMLQQDPKDRPSVQEILEYPALQEALQSYLEELKLDDEEEDDEYEDDWEEDEDKEEEDDEGEDEDTGVDAHPLASQAVQITEDEGNWQDGVSTERAQRAMQRQELEWDAERYQKLREENRRVLRDMASKQKQLGDAHSPEIGKRSTRSEAEQQRRRRSRKKREKKMASRRKEMLQARANDTEEEKVARQLEEALRESERQARAAERKRVRDRIRRDRQQYARLEKQKSDQNSQDQGTSESRASQHDQQQQQQDVVVEVFTPQPPSVSESQESEHEGPADQELVQTILVLEKPERSSDSSGSPASGPGTSSGGNHVQTPTPTPKSRGGHAHNPRTKRAAAAGTPELVHFIEEQRKRNRRQKNSTDQPRAKLVMHEYLKPSVEENTSEEDRSEVEFDFVSAEKSGDEVVVAQATPLVISVNQQPSESSTHTAQTPRSSVPELSPTSEKAKELWEKRDKLGLMHVLGLIQELSQSDDKIQELSQSDEIIVDEIDRLK